MPPLGYSRDRRSIHQVLEVYNDESVKSLVCFVCAQIHCTAPRSASDVPDIRVVKFGQMREKMSMSRLEYTLGLEGFLRHFPNPAPNYSGPRSSRYPDGSGNAADWVRTAQWRDRRGPREFQMLCCPEDVS